MPDRRSLLIVANPTSGRGRGRRTAEAVASALRDTDTSVRVEFTNRSGDAETIARRACASGPALPECIVACGGDGTIQEVANALADAHEANRDMCPPLGLAPAGRCNDFARALGISHDIRKIIDVLRQGTPQPIDLGRVNGRYFCTVATLGVDAEVSNFVDVMRMPLTGTIAYVYGAVRVLMRYRSKRIKLIGDFGTIEQSVFLASSANTSSYGGAIKIAPAANPRDGKLMLCLIDSVSRWRSFRLLPRIFTGRHVHLPEVRFLATRKFRIESETPIEMWADGERITHTPALVEAVPQAVHIILPPSQPGTDSHEAKAQPAKDSR